MSFCKTVLVLFVVANSARCDGGSPLEKSSQLDSENSQNHKAGSLPTESTLRSLSLPLPDELEDEDSNYSGSELYDYQCFQITSSMSDHAPSRDKPGSVRPRVIRPDVLDHARSQADQSPPKAHPTQLYCPEWGPLGERPRSPRRSSDPSLFMSQPHVFPRVPSPTQSQSEHSGRDTISMHHSMVYPRMYLRTDSDCRMRVNVDLNAIKHNYEFFNRMVAPAKCAAVVKSNAYGLGLGPIAQTLFECGARSFIVSFVSEAIELATQIARNSKEYLLEKIMLGGDFNVPAYNEGTGYIVYVLYPETPEDWKNILLFRFIPMINSLRDLGMYEKYANKLNRILPCVCNVDTGLHKRGMKASDVPELGQYLKIRLATPNYDRQTDEDKDRRHTYFKFVMSHPTAVSLNDENSRTFYPPRLATDPRQASVTSVSLATDPDPRRASVGMPVCDSLDLTDPDPRRASVETPVCDALHDRSRTARSNYARVLAQLEQLEQIRATLQDAGGQELPCSFCNTYWAAVFAARGMPVDNPRIGSGLYGLTDVPGTRLCAAIWVRVVDVQTINGGESIGYEGEFFCERATRVAVLHVGYNDGIGSKQTKVGINGNICSILSLYMDTIVVDIGSVDVNIGDWGRILDQSTLYVACYKLRPGVLFEYNPLHPSEQ